MNVSPNHLLFPMFPQSLHATKEKKESHDYLSFIEEQLLIRTVCE